MITVTYQYKLKPTKQQIQTFEQWLETCKKVWNFALRERKDWVNSRKSPINSCSLKAEYIIPADAPRPNYFSQAKQLTTAKKIYPELTIPHVHVLQQTLRQLEAGGIFVEDINFKAWAKGLFGKYTLDAAYGQFFNVLSYVCWKRGVYFAKVDKDYSSQICPNCQTHTGKKDLSERVHFCSNCGYTTNRDVAAAQVLCQRGLVAVGQPVNQIAFGGVLSGVLNNA